MVLDKNANKETILRNASDIFFETFEIGLAHSTISLSLRVFVLNWSSA